MFGVFTHLDQFRTSKGLQKTKKVLKHRFWTEIYDGAKMFYFSGVVNGKYLKNEVKQLQLFISRVKVCGTAVCVCVRVVLVRKFCGDEKRYIGDFCPSPIGTKRVDWT